LEQADCRSFQLQNEQNPQGHNEASASAYATEFGTKAEHSLALRQADACRQLAAFAE